MATHASVTVLRSMILRSSAANDADRNISALRAQVLMGNPSTADAMVTVLRKAILRTQEDPNADRRVTKLALQVLRAVRRGDVARPGVQGRAVFNDTTVTPGEGEYDINGYYAVGSRYSGFTGMAYVTPGTYDSGGPVYAGYEPVLGPSKVPFTVGYGAGGSLERIVQQWHEGMTQRTADGFLKPLYNVTYLPVEDIRDYPYAFNVVAEVDDQDDVNNHGPGGNGNFPIGMCAEALTQKSWGITSTYPAIYAKVEADFSVNGDAFGLQRVQPYPDVDAQQWALPAFSLVQNVAPTFGSEFLSGSGLSPYRFDQATSIRVPSAPYGVGPVTETVSPRLTIQRGLGRGAYKLCPNSYRDWTVQQDGLPPIRFPLQGANDPLDEMYGVTYGTERALWDALVANVDLSPMNLDWPARQDNMQYRQSVSETVPENNYYWWATMPHRWGPVPTYNFSPAEDLTTTFVTFVTFDDGMYITSTGEKRYSRYKTLMLTQKIAYDRQEDLSGVDEGAFYLNQVHRGYLSETSVGEALGMGVSWDAFAVATVITETIDPDIVNDLSSWIVTQPEYPDEYLTFGAGQAKTFYLRFFNEFHPELVTGLNAAWDARQAELEAVVIDYTKRWRTSTPMYWDADDIDPTFYTGNVMPPVFFVQKLDSPSTHFNDPPGTPGVDDF